MLTQITKDKLEYTKELIHCWVDSWGIDQVYISFSGGLDSTALLHIARDLYPDMRAMFLNTGLEYPEITTFVKSFDNVDIVHPKMPFHKVVEKFGYPVISKEQSQFIYQWRNTKSDKLRDIRWNGRGSGSGSKISEKWKTVAKDAPFKISHMCCDKLKKEPAKKYEKSTGRHPIIGNMSGESSLRKQGNHVCNIYDVKRPNSRPIIKWVKQDILDYVREYEVEYCSVYDSPYIDRTGCLFCLFGAHYHKPNRIQLLEKTHPNLYRFCLDKLGMREVMEYMELPVTLEEE